MPARGMLYFFYEVYSQPWGGHDEQDGWRIIFHPDEDPTNLHCTAHPTYTITDVEIQALPPHIIKFRHRWVLPMLFEAEEGKAHGLDMDDDAFILYFDKLVASRETLHYFFGFPYPIQGSVVYACAKQARQLHITTEIEAEVPNWQFLFQIDSDDDLDMMWGDSGILYVCIPIDSLKNRNFDDSWTIMQCS
ncbi:MAG: YwqG family protein [Chloroflexota bacterium]